MMIDAHAYTISVKKLRVDNEELFRATVAEFPDVEPYASTYHEAYELAVESLEALSAAYEEEGRPFPPPTDEEHEFSGRVTLRIPKTVHRHAATIAAAEGVSLNQWLVSTVSLAVGIQGNTMNRTSETRELTLSGAGAISSGCWVLWSRAGGAVGDIEGTQIAAMDNYFNCSSLSERGRDLLWSEPISALTTRENPVMMINVPSSTSSTSKLVGKARKASPLPRKHMQR
jgi:predicted HicB family RNase H-like nuclease